MPVKLPDVLILIGVVAAGGGLALLLGGGFPSQVVMMLSSSGGGVYVGTRIRNRKNLRGGQSRARLHLPK